MRVLLGCVVLSFFNIAGARAQAPPVEVHLSQAQFDQRDARLSRRLRAFGGVGLIGIGFGIAGIARSEHVHDMSPLLAGFAATFMSAIAMGIIGRNRQQLRMRPRSGGAGVPIGLTLRFDSRGHPMPPRSTL